MKKYSPTFTTVLPNVSIGIIKPKEREENTIIPNLTETH
jgi:hypothetical protein